MKKRFQTGLLYIGAAAMLAGCGQSTGATATTAANTALESTAAAEETSNNAETESVPAEGKEVEGAVNIVLSDDEILVDGETISENIEDAVYAAHDIVYYEDGKDFTYGEGTEKDAHSKEEADAHTVVHITKPGTYAVSGTISAGQIAIDLGEDAEEDPEAVVTLILNGAEIHCSVAPGVIFYNVYECGETDEESASKDVDTTEAGANVVIADGTENLVEGSYVARIYKSVELNEAGTEVVDSKKLHKYDGAFYSKMSMNVDGGEEGTGSLQILAENEGLDSELHLTINGGNISIVSGNDGINTNEDGVSVTTVNGGTLRIQVDGSTGEGDGIDSNGWIVINDGTVIAEACSSSPDAGIDSDMGIHINGGTVIATGNMLDQISESEQNYAVFSFADRQTGGETITLKDAEGNEVMSCSAENAFTYLIFSDEGMKDGAYTLWSGETQLEGSSGMSAGGGFGGGMGGGRPGKPEDFDPEKMTPPEKPDGGQKPDIPAGADAGQKQQGGDKHPDDETFRGERGNRGNMEVGESSSEFSIAAGGSYFSYVTEATAE